MSVSPSDFPMLDSRYASKSNAQPHSPALDQIAAVYALQGCILQMNTEGVWAAEFWLNDMAGNASVDYGARHLYSPGGFIMLNWDYGYMSDESEKVSIDWYSRQLRSYSDAVSLDWENRQLSDWNSNPSVNWDWRSLLLPDETAVLNWGSMELLDQNYILSVGWWTRELVDKSYNTSVSWEERQLYDGQSRPSIFWDQRVLSSPDGNTVLNWEYSELYDLNYLPSLNWNERMLYDASQNWSLDWENQQLIARGGLVATVDWGLCELNNEQGKVLSWNSGLQMSVDALWNANTGPVLRSPDGKKWRIQVSNTGALSTVQTY